MVNAYLRKVHTHGRGPNRLGDVRYSLAVYLTIASKTYWCRCCSKLANCLNFAS